VVDPCKDSDYTSLCIRTWSLSAGDPNISVIEKDNKDNLCQSKFATMLSISSRWNGALLAAEPGMKELFMKSWTFNQKVPTIEDIPAWAAMEYSRCNIGVEQITKLFSTESDVYALSELKFHACLYLLVEGFRISTDQDVFVSDFEFTTNLGAPWSPSSHYVLQGKYIVSPPSDKVLKSMGLSVPLLQAIVREAFDFLNQFPFILHQLLQLKYTTWGEEWKQILDKTIQIHKRKDRVSRFKASAIMHDSQITSIPKSVLTNE